MSGRLGILTREEEEVVLEMRDVVLLSFEAKSMAHVLQAALQGLDADEVAGACAWIAGQITVALERIDDILKTKSEEGA